ncbi:MAG: hypothetical protein J6Q89_02825, partial [Clostridia bacterium]|nr:hypothetical protein [Clostridia bacterium]
MFFGNYNLQKDENENVEDTNVKEQNVETQIVQEQNSESENSEIQNDVSSDKTVGPSLITNVKPTIRNATVNDEHKPSVTKIANDPAVKQNEKEPKKSKKSKWFIPITIIALLTLIGGIIGAIALSNSECKHNWRRATSCKEFDTCTICGMATGLPKGHTWIEATCTKPKTCSVCSETEGIAKGHKWTAATYSQPKTCSVCKKTEGSPLHYEEAAGVNVALHKPYSGGEEATAQPGYNANLTDGIATNIGSYDSNWFGFYYNAGAATPSNNAPNGVGSVVIDLGANTYDINTIRVNVFNCNNSGIVAPERIVAYISTDGSHFTELGNLTLPEGNDPSWAYIAVNNLSARYVKLVVDMGEGGSWCFINEIEVYAKS